MKKDKDNLRQFLYKNRDIIFVVTLIAAVKSWDLIKELFMRRWFIILPAGLATLWILRAYLKRFLRYLIFDIGPSLAVAGLAAFLIMSFIIQPFKIPTGSMKPALLDGDYILVNKFIYGARIPFTDIRFPKLRNPQRGDIIVFVSPAPEDKKRDFIKRLIGLPGESVQIRSGSVYIDEKVLTEDKFQRWYYSHGVVGVEGNIVRVPTGQYYVLGDNSFSSKDSRYWGFVPGENVLGKAILIWWPPHRIRILK